MQRFSISYTKAVNKRYNRVGSLFQGPFQAKHIHKESHLLHLCRYIHNNPVKDGLVAEPTDWPYSNYLEWIGAREGTLYSPGFISQHFDNLAEYKLFILDGLHDWDLPSEIKKYFTF